MNAMQDAVWTKVQCCGRWKEFIVERFFDLNEMEMWPTYRLWRDPFSPSSQNLRLTMVMPTIDEKFKSRVISQHASYINESWKESTTFMLAFMKRSNVIQTQQCTLQAWQKITASKWIHKNPSKKCIRFFFFLLVAEQGKNAVAKCIRSCMRFPSPIMTE